MSDSPSSSESPASGAQGADNLGTRSDGSSLAVTRGVRVLVQPHYLAEHSDPARGRWMHAYRVIIENTGPEQVQLLSRHWIITNGEGAEEHVRGPGVVGEQPVLSPGQRFEYASGCPLDTPVGAMHGTYTLVTASGERFEAEIAPFTLADPLSLN